MSLAASQVTPNTVYVGTLPCGWNKERTACTFDSLNCEIVPLSHQASKFKKLRSEIWFKPLVPHWTRAPGYPQAVPVIWPWRHQVSQTDTHLHPAPTDVTLVANTRWNNVGAFKEKPFVIVFILLAQQTVFGSINDMKHSNMSICCQQEGKHYQTPRRFQKWCSVPNLAQSACSLC